MLTSRYGTGYGMGYSSYKEAEALASLGHDVSVVCINPIPNEYSNARISFIHQPISDIPIFEFFSFYFRLRKLFKKKLNINSFDAIYIQSLEFGLVNFRKVEKPVYYFARSTMKGLGDALKQEHVHIKAVRKVVQKVLIWLEYRCMENSKRVLVKSYQMKDEVSRLYRQDERKIEVIQGGLDCQAFSSVNLSIHNLKQRFGIPSNKKIVMYAGRIVPQKGLKYLVEASLELLAEQDFALIIVGEPTDVRYTAEIKKRVVNSPQKDNIFFIGHVDQHNVPLVFVCADIVATPSIYEPFGMVNIQAASLGKWVITTDQTGSREILQSYSRIIVVKGHSSEALKTAIRDALLLQNGHFVPKFGEGHSWQIVGRHLQKIFTEVK